MCPLKREQARREMQQWVMRRLPTADSIVEIGRKVGHELSVCVRRPVDVQTEHVVLLVSSCSCGRALEHASFVTWPYRAHPASVSLPAAISQRLIANFRNLTHSPCSSVVVQSCVSTEGDLSMNFVNFSVNNFFLYPPSERSEPGGYTIFTFECVHPFVRPSSCEQSVFRCKYLETVWDSLELGTNYTLIGNGLWRLWRIEWWRRRWRHATLKGQGCDPNIFKARLKTARDRDSVLTGHHLPPNSI